MLFFFHSFFLCVITRDETRNLYTHTQKTPFDHTALRTLISASFLERDTVKWTLTPCA